MKNKIILFSFASLLAFQLCAQDAPGYQGKIMSFGYTPSFSIAATNVNSNKKVTGILGDIMGITYNDSIPTAFLALNVTHSFNFNYVAKRNRSYIGALHFMKSGCWIDPYNGYYRPNPSGGGVDFTTSNYFAKISGIGFDIGFKKYAHNLAPIGRYAGYKLGLNFYTSNAPTIDSLKGGWWTSKATVKMGSQKIHYKNIRLIYTWGKQTVIKDKFLLDISLDWDMISSTAGFFRIANDNESNDKYDETVLGDQYYKETIRKIKTRLLCRDAVEIRVGLSYLL